MERAAKSPSMGRWTCSDWLALIRRKIQQMVRAVSSNDEKLWRNGKPRKISGPAEETMSQATKR